MNQRFGLNEFIFVSNFDGELKENNDNFRLLCKKYQTLIINAFRLCAFQDSQVKKLLENIPLIVEIKDQN